MLRSWLLTVFGETDSSWAMSSRDSWVTNAARTICSRLVSDGGGANPSTGYSILEAKNLDEAVRLSKDCPIFKSGGSIEVAELMPM